MLKQVRPFFEDACSQLGQTHHFGVLGVLLSSEKALTRRTYVETQCDVLLRVKNAAIGAGLGSKNGFPRDDPDRDDFAPLREWTGLAVCQAWTVLLNSGHLFGTFATERGLLFRLDRELVDREDFVADCVDFDRSRGNELRGIVERALNDARLHSFHYLLALWRLRDDGVSGLSDGDRHVARLLLKAFLDPPSEVVKRWREIFRQVRRLTYLSLHRSVVSAKYTVGADALEPSDLSVLFPTDAFPDLNWMARSRWSVLEAIDRHDASHMFGSTEAAAEVLAHIERFKVWWSDRKLSGQAFSQMLDDLYFVPDDWNSPTKGQYRTFANLRVPSRLDWLTETRLWLRDRDQRDPWNGSNFFVTPDPVGGPLSVDIYVGQSGFSVGALRHCVEQLARAYSGLHSDADNQLLWMSGANLMAQAFSSCLKAEYAIRIQPVKASPGHVGYASLGDTYEMVRGLVKSFLVACDEPGRENELRQLLAITDKMSYWRRPAMVMLAKTVVVDRADGRHITDIDGLSGLFDGSSLNWVVMECKKRGSADGGKQLREGLGPCMIGNVGVVQHFEHGTCEAWSLTVPSPETLKTPELATPNSPLQLRLPFSL